MCLIGSTCTASPCVVDCCDQRTGAPMLPGVAICNMGSDMRCDMGRDLAAVGSASSTAATAAAAAAAAAAEAAIVAVATVVGAAAASAVAAATAAA